MNPTIHIALAIVITIFFIVSYWKMKKSYHLVLAIWIPTTLLQYLSTNRTYTMILGAVQLVFFAIVIITLFYSHRKTVKQMYAQMKQEPQGADDLQIPIIKDSENSENDDFSK